MFIYFRMLDSLKRTWYSAETSNKSNKSFYKKVFVFLLISKLYPKKFKHLSLCNLICYSFSVFIFNKVKYLKVLSNNKKVALVFNWQKY